MESITTSLWLAIYWVSGLNFAYLFLRTDLGTLLLVKICALRVSPAVTRLTVYRRRQYFCSSELKQPCPMEIREFCNFEQVGGATYTCIRFIDEHLDISYWSFIFWKYQVKCISKRSLGTEPKISEILDLWGSFFWVFTEIRFLHTKTRARDTHRFPEVLWELFTNQQPTWAGEQKQKYWNFNGSRRFCFCLIASMLDFV